MTEHTALRREIVELIPRLRRFALGLTGHQADADDIVQTALEKALGRLDQFKPGTRLDSWLFRIVQTSWIDNRRKAVRREDTMDADMMARLPGQTDPGYEGTYAVRQDVTRALDSLPDKQRVLAVLVLVEGYSYQEAADATDSPIGTVMSRLSRARKSMMMFLNQEDQ